MVAKTVIQADGDIILFLSEEAVSQPDLIREHLNKIKSEVNSFDALKSILEKSKIWVSAASALLAIHQTYHGNPMGMAAAIASFLGSFYLMPVLMRLVRTIISRRLRRMVGGSAGHER